MDTRKSCDLFKGNHVENEITEKIGQLKIVSDENMATETKTSNLEQEIVIKKLKEVLNFLERTQIKNEESLVNLNKPLDDLLDCLKYLPTEPCFDIIPSEIKTNILSYLCNSGAFVAASVCNDWRDVLMTKLNKMEGVDIGLHCSNQFECEDCECFMPKEILEASIILNLDIPLTICYFVNDVDSQLIAEALTNVSDFTICGDCFCVGEDGVGEPVLTNEQIKHLMKSLEKKGKIMEKMCLEVVDTTFMLQGRIINYLLDKVKNLTLNEGGLDFGRPYCRVLSIEILVSKLLAKDSSDLKLSHLSLVNVRYRDYLSLELADALCKVESVELCSEFPSLTNETVERIVENVLTRDINMKALVILKNFDWRPLISSEDLKRLIGKMEALTLLGKFTPEQVEAAKSFPGVKANLREISNSSEAQGI